MTDNDSVVHIKHEDEVVTEVEAGVDGAALETHLFDKGRTEVLVPQFCSADVAI